MLFFRVVAVNLVLTLLAGQLTHAFPFEERVIADVRALHEFVAPGVELPNLQLRDRYFRLSGNPGVEPGLATLFFKGGEAKFWPDNGRLNQLKLPKLPGPTVPQDEIERRALRVLERFVEPGDTHEPGQGKFDHIAETYTVSTSVVHRSYYLASYRVVLHSQTAQLLELEVPRRFFDFSHPITPIITADEAFRIAARTYLAHKPLGLTDFQRTERPGWSKVEKKRPRVEQRPDFPHVEWQATVDPKRVGKTTLRSITRFGWQLGYVDWVSGRTELLFGFVLDEGRRQRQVESEANIEGRTWQLFDTNVSGSLRESEPGRQLGSAPPAPKRGRRVLLLSDPYVMSGIYNATSGRLEVELSKGTLYLEPDHGLAKALERSVR